MLGKILKLIICALLAFVLVIACGLFIYHLFDQSERAIGVVPFTQAN